MRQNKHESTIYYRVVGFGKETAPVIDSINSHGYDGVAAIVHETKNTFGPGEDDRMIIILAPVHTDAAEVMARDYRKSGVLTLVITNDSTGWDQDTMDSMMVTDTGCWAMAVSNLLNPVFLTGPINFDFHDLYITLHNTSHFTVKESIGRGDEKMKSAVGDLSLKILSDTLMQVEKIVFIIYFNPDMNPMLRASETNYLTQYIEQIPYETDVFWAVKYDGNQDHDYIKIGVIASGKNL